MCSPQSRRWSSSPQGRYSKTSKFFIPNDTPADVTDRLEGINPSLAAQARVVLDINKAERHIRGGLATKEKYQHQLQACSTDEKLM